jgi:hypothetical protein
MKKSFYFYGNNYDKEFMKDHAGLFLRQSIWADMLAKELMEEPLVTRDMHRVNQCLKARKWNMEKHKEIYYDKDISL